MSDSMYTGKARVTVTDHGKVVRQTIIDHSKKSDRWRLRLLVHEALNAGHIILTEPVED